MPSLFYVSWWRGGRAEHEKLDVVISSRPGVGRVRRSRERVRGLLTIPLSHFVTAPLH